MKNCKIMSDYILSSEQRSWAGSSHGEQLSCAHVRVADRYKGRAAGPGHPPQKGGVLPSWSPL